MLGYLVVRLLLWIAGVFIALFPTLHAAGTDAIFPSPFETAQAINDHELFRDLIFVVVVVSVLGISAIIDFMHVKYSKANQILRTFIIIVLIGNIITLGSGLVAFMNLPPHGKIVNLQWLWIEYMLIWFAVIIGLATEVVTACANHHYR